MGEDKTREQLEEQNELLQNQLRAIMGESREVGILTAQGMTQRQATILHILVKRAPAVVSRQTLHLLFYGDRADGGPEPKIFDVQVSRLRAILRREHKLTKANTGKIVTTWNAGYRADPALVAWAQNLYKTNIPQEG
jgi:DNA-binding response OmpR family regulator